MVKIDLSKINKSRYGTVEAKITNKISKTFGTNSGKIIASKSGNVLIVDEDVDFKSVEVVEFFKANVCDWERTARAIQNRIKPITIATIF